MTASRNTRTVRKLKSYSSVEIKIDGVPAGGEPCMLVVKVFNKKKPTAEVQILAHYFSESRGTGSSSGKRTKLTDIEAVGLCQALIAGEGVLPVLIDRLQDLRVNQVARFWQLYCEPDAGKFLHAERRAKNFANKQFEVGEKVLYGTYPPQEGEIVNTYFDEVDCQWRYAVPGYSGPASRFRKMS